MFTATTFATYIVVGFKDPGFVKTNHFKIETENVYHHYLIVYVECDKLHIGSLSKAAQETKSNQTTINYLRRTRGMTLLHL